MCQSWSDPARPYHQCISTSSIVSYLFLVTSLPPHLLWQLPHLILVAFLCNFASLTFLKNLVVNFTVPPTFFPYALDFLVSWCQALRDRLWCYSSKSCIPHSLRLSWSVHPLALGTRISRLWNWVHWSPKQCARLHSEENTLKKTTPQLPISFNFFSWHDAISPFPTNSDRKFSDISLSSIKLTDA